MANKLIGDLTTRSNFDASCNVPVDDGVQTWKATGAQVRTFIKNDTVDASAGTAGITIQAADEEVHAFNPSTAITVKLANDFAAGEPVGVMNKGTAKITVTANDDTTICEVLPGYSAKFMAIAAAAATATNWMAIRSWSPGDHSVKTDDYVITDGDNIATAVMNAGTAKAFTMPAVATNVGRRITFFNIGAGTLTLTRAGSAVFLGIKSTSATSLTLLTNQSLTVVCNGTNWQVVGTTQLATKSYYGLQPANRIKIRQCNTNGVNRTFAGHSSGATSSDQICDKFDNLTIGRKYRLVVNCEVDEKGSTTNLISISFKVGSSGAVALGNTAFTRLDTKSIGSGTSYGFSGSVVFTATAVCLVVVANSSANIQTNPSSTAFNTVTLEEIEEEVESVTDWD